MLRRLRIKFVCINMAIVTIMLCVIFALMLTSTRINLEQQSIQMMQSVAAAPTALGRPDETADHARLPYFSLQVDPDGQVIATSGGYFDLSDQGLLDELVAASSSSGSTTGILPQYGLRYCRVVSPTSQYIIFADMSSEQTTLNDMLRTCLLVGGVSFLAFLVISLFLARWAVKPVEQAWDQQKQFIADASHELKTPVTVISMSAQLLQEPEYPPEQKSRFAAQIATMSRQMQGLVESLLELARVDDGGAKMTFSTVDYSKLVEDALLPFEVLYYERGLTLDSRIQPGIQLQGSAPHLKQAVDVLLDNARKYATPQTQVEVQLDRPDHGHCVLSVSTRGDAISQEDLKNIFKRFYRLDAARSMNHSYGLGLSIAQGIVIAHHGRIWARSEGGVNTFLIQLPLH